MIANGIMIDVTNIVKRRALIQTKMLPKIFRFGEDSSLFLVWKYVNFLVDHPCFARFKQQSGNHDRQIVIKYI